MNGAYALEWLNLVVRWLHFTAGIMWIGASFYFVWLDNNLTKPASDRERGVLGELWSVHGGGFYHNQKYPTGPIGEPLAEHLHWFKWEAYTTWLSGIALLALVYWVGASTFLVDPSVMNLTGGEAIAISIASLVVGWLVYDTLCKVLEKRPYLLGVAVFVFLSCMAWGLAHVFKAQAAYLHVGAIIGTIMVANVAHVIIPGQKKMVAQIRAGQQPDPRPGELGKTRSVHNTYFTLPVLFTMISGHYPMTYESRYAWLVLVALGLAGVLVRYFFILTHAKYGGRLVWVLPITALAIVAGAAFAVVPRSTASTATVSFAQVAPIFAQRCAVCHSAHPTAPGFAAAPGGVLLDTPAHIRENAVRIQEQAVETRAMPLNNITNMTQSERDEIGAWIAQGARR
ncbi:MAG TPA: urate hydroxylase PuuD [Candidatus Tyrphobacter sp.]